MEKFVIGKIYTLEEKTASNAPILAAREAKNGHSALYNALVNPAIHGWKTVLAEDGAISGYQYTGYRFKAPDADCWTNPVCAANAKKAAAQLVGVFARSSLAEAKTALGSALKMFSNEKLQEMQSAPSESEASIAASIFAALNVNINRTTGEIEARSIKAGAAYRALCLIASLRFQNKKLTRISDESLAQAVEAAAKAEAKAAAAAEKRADKQAAKKSPVKTGGSAAK